MSDPRAVRKEFEAFIDKVAPDTPKEPKFTIVVSADYYDRYDRWLAHADKYSDLGTPAENLLWKGHIIVRGH
jgi:hypothetical protein